MGNELKPVVGSAAEQNHEEITIPPFVQNMVKIGRIVSRLGTTPLAYAGAQIRFLESCEDENQGFRAEVYVVDSDDPYMVLVKRGLPAQGPLLPNYDHVEISYRPNTKISLRVKKDEYPESEEFEKPENLPPGSLFTNRGRSIFLWMSFAMLGPKTQSFLNRVTEDALSEFVALDQNKQVVEPKEFEPNKPLK